MSTASKEIRETLRLMAWERAKGELHSMLQTYWPGDSGVYPPSGVSEQYMAVKNCLETFIKDFEDKHC